MSGAAPVPWDGWRNAYIPSSPLQVDPVIRLHNEATDMVDPITYEVLRHALWNVNVEHGATIMRVSGSPATVYGHDFNTVILDELGDYVFVGHFHIYLSVAVGSAVKWTLENRAKDPGIGPGDMFLTTDPWIGTTHQVDATLLAPVFVGEELFCWVGNTVHTWDLGGSAPGGFNPLAKDVFWEQLCVPPVRIVERGKLRRDVEEMYTRASRLPALVALDLRSGVTGARTAVDAIERLVARYGAATIKGSMRKIQDDAERAFVKRLRTIPDGTWSEEGWLETASPGDRELYPNRVTVEKRGDRLTFTNIGSAEQIGTLNATFPAWRGAVVAAFVAEMLFDQMFAIEGALRCCDFVVESSLVSCASRPAAVSGATVVPLLHSLGLSGLVISKMLSCSSDPELRTESQSCPGTLVGMVNLLRGVDQRGRSFVSFLMEPIAAALPAKASSDGQDTGGWPTEPLTTIPNVEDFELFYPILYLWRRELPDSGGAGRFRGGNSGELAIALHRTDRLLLSTVGSQVCVPGPGLFGGYPTSTNGCRLIRGSGIVAALADGAAMPTSIEELGGPIEHIPPRSFDIPFERGDVWVHGWAAASGYGDPLLRERAAVEADVQAGRVTQGWARTAYGVVVGDAAETERLRSSLLAERIGGPPGPPPAHRAALGGQRLGAALEVLEGAIACRRCGTKLADVGGDFRSGAIAARRALQELNPHIPDARIFTDVSVEATTYCCPGCAVLLQCAIAVGGADPPLDIELGRTLVVSGNGIGRMVR